ncbi:MAG: transglycosylase family protein [Acidimicrobiales bacterium]
MKRAIISAAVTAAAVSLSASPALASTPHSRAAHHHHHRATHYLVRPGDSFWAISQKYGITMQDLAAYNATNLWGVLYAGTTLRIPPTRWQPATSAAPAASPAEAAVPAAPAASSYSPSGVWACIAAHESGSNPATNTGNGYYGMYQFTLGSWAAAGGAGNPADAPAAQQTAVAQRLQQMQGWGAWPVSSVACGA